MSNGVFIVKNLVYYRLDSCMNKFFACFLTFCRHLQEGDMKKILIVDDEKPISDIIKFKNWTKK